MSTKALHKYLIIQRFTCDFEQGISKLFWKQPFYILNKTWVILGIQFHLQVIGLIFIKAMWIFYYCFILLTFSVAGWIIYCVIALQDHTFFDEYCLCHFTSSICSSYIFTLKRLAIKIFLIFKLVSYSLQVIFIPWLVTNSDKVGWISSFQSTNYLEVYYLDKIEGEIWFNKVWL